LKTNIEADSKQHYPMVHRFMFCLASNYLVQLEYQLTLHKIEIAILSGQRVTIQLDTVL